LKNISNKILQLKEVNAVIERCILSKKIFCIGIDGPTASGKTIFSKLLFDEIKKQTKKNVKIIPLDYLLIARQFRSKSLDKIIKNNMQFEHEAEIHMNFNKIDILINSIKKINAGYLDKKRIKIDKLYSRKNFGKCTANIDLTLKKNLILIFEGHYTTRPGLDAIIDENFILLSDKDTLIQRKIDRSSSYRNKNDVKTYFEYIDEPSYLSNYERFSNNNSIIINNSFFSDPVITDYASINKFLDFSKF